jgi:hypothetical protein
MIFFTLPLVAKNEKCLFTLKPVNDTVGNFIEYLKNEDRSIEKAGIYKQGKNYNLHEYLKRKESKFLKI